MLQFDQAETRALAGELAKDSPNRVPGSSGALRAEQWFRDQLSQYGLPLHADTWRQDVPGLGTVRLRGGLSALAL